MEGNVTQPTQQTVESGQEATLTDYLLPLGQALLFVVAVYVDKFVRKRIWGKQYKELTRIVTMTILTAVLMLFDYEQKCRPEGIGFGQCFYLHYDLKQCLHTIILNTILFGHHIEMMWTYSNFKSSKTFLRTAVFAPMLEELLFRGVFYRSSSGRVSIVYLSLLFSIAHFHKYIYKTLRGKNPSLSASLVQLAFTFLFALYSYYILYIFQSVIPCIILHVYCNILGPPNIASIKMLITHIVCIALFFLYLKYYI